MKVIALVPYPYNTVGGQRYRLEQWQPELKKMGIDLRFQHLLQDFSTVEDLWRHPPSWRSMAALTRATLHRVWQACIESRPDAVIVYREASMMGPPIVEAITTLHTPLVFDFDDAIWLSSQGTESRFLRNQVRMPWKTKWIIRMSAGVSAGNQYLANYASEFCNTVRIIPSTIDTMVYAAQKNHSSAEPLIIGWSGSIWTAPYLSALLPTLAEIARAIPLRLRVIGAEVSHPGLDIESIRWQPNKEVDDLLPIDVGLMPQPDNPWTRGKCGMKALQYMALGIPAIVSPVGVNREIVADGINGYLARNPEDWRRAIVALRDPAERNRLGGAARRTVVDRYSASHGTAEFAELLESVARQR